MNAATANNEQLAVIDQQKDLAHLNELVVEITGLKEGYKDLTIEGPEDKDGYEKVRAAIGVLRPKRTSLERERKDVVRPYNEVVKHINGKYDEIFDMITDGAGGERELKEKKDFIDQIIEREKEEKRLEEEKKINDRINELISKGMVFDGNFYAISAPDLGISETSIGVVDIRTMSDDLYKNFLQIVVDKAGKIAAEKERVAAEEKKLQEEKLAAEKKEREEFAAQKKQMEEQQAAMQKQQDDIKAQQNKLDAAKREAEQKQQQIEQDKVNNIIRHRSSILVGIGLEYNDQRDSFDYDGEALISDGPCIADYDDVLWLELLDKLKAIIAGKKFAAEEFLKKEHEKETERLRLQELERQAGLNDQQKMKEYIALLLNIPVPEFKTKKWKTTAGGIREYISDNCPA